MSLALWGVCECVHLPLLLQEDPSEMAVEVEVVSFVGVGVGLHDAELLDEGDAV